MKKLINFKERGYQWNYCSLGGVVRVKLSSGEDIAHLDELDQKMWTVLSCPAKDLHFDERTLQYLDSDKDGRIKVQEVIAASKWLTSLVKDKDKILEGRKELHLDEIDTSTEYGAGLHRSALRILNNLGLEKDSISLEDTSDFNRIAGNSLFNGDGVICPSSLKDRDLKAALEACMDTMGSVDDVNGEKGADAALVEAFYTALSDWTQWFARAQEDPSILPYGPDTAAALDACEAINTKVTDYFMRCKMIAFDEDVQSVLDVSVDRIGSVSAGNLSASTEEIIACPLARPRKSAMLPLDEINPSWRETFNKVASLVLDKDFQGKKMISEDDWNSTLAKFAPYKAWLSDKKGAEVEKMGAEAVEEILSAGKKDALMAIIGADKALEDEIKSMKEVDKLVRYYAYLYKFLCNYVVFSDFYSLNPRVPAIFETGRLYIDQRCCQLCIKVKDMAAHSDMASLSGMFLLYCHCHSKTMNADMDIVAVMTDGRTANLRAGKNAVFYDMEGNDWDAVVTKIVDNPISIRQAFWSPYRKFANFVSEKISKSASEKEGKIVGEMQTSADKAVLVPDAAADGKEAKPAVKVPFDIAKFAGIFAAIGMALGYIGAFFTEVITGVASSPVWETLIVILAIMLCISGPSCFLAWCKLRRRNLGPVLNANGWAINAVLLVNIIFGATLTSTAKYPKLHFEDPFLRKKTPFWRVALYILLGLAIVAAVLYFTNVFGCLK